MSKQKIIISKKEIEVCHILGVNYPVNKISLNIGNEIFIYHSWDNDKQQGGRAYDTTARQNMQNYTLFDDKQRLDYIIPEWEDDSNGQFQVLKNVNVSVYFTLNGWKKFKKHFK